MAIVFRTFRSRSGRDGELLESLRCAAARMLQSQPGSVVVCRTHDPRELVWVASRDAGAEAVDDSVGDALVAASPARSLRFVDGWYRLPAPPYHVWNFEVHAAGEDPLDTLRGVLEHSSWSRGHPHLVGRCVYRAVEDPSVFIGFVGLTGTWLPGSEMARARMAERIAWSVIWRPLVIVYHLERTRGGATRTGVGEEASRAPFWARAATPPLSMGLADAHTVLVACTT